MSDDLTVDDLDMGDEIRFKIPHGDTEGDVTTGCVAGVGDEYARVKAGPYWGITDSEIVEIVEKQKFVDD